MSRVPGVRAAGAAAKAARRASAVYRAVVGGPEGKPSGAVNLKDFRQVLPWLRWEELASCAQHFGKRGPAAESLPGALAAEVGKRLGSRPPALEGPGDAASAQSATAFQVSTIVWGFNKLRPQLPEYAAIYEAAAGGILRGEWRLRPLQAALIGAAFADQGVHLEDALPAVLRPVLGELLAGGGGVEIDELRFLLHACGSLPPGSLSAEDVDALAGCTERLAVSADFAQAAHLAVSWLRLEVPLGAKRAHLDALRAACAQVLQGTPCNTASPLPTGGLAPAIARLLAREELEAQPPLTPPALGQVVKAIEQISRGQRKSHTRGDRTRTLSLADMVETVRLAVDFCEAHGLSSTCTGARRELPSWLAHSLGYVAFKARMDTQPAELEAILSLLELLRRFRPAPEHDERFYSWAAGQLGRRGVDGLDQVALARAIRGLVPHLTATGREELMQAVAKVPRHARAAKQVLAVNGRPPLRMLTGVGLLPETRVSLSPAGLEPPAAAAAPASASAQARTDSTAAESLWGLMAEPGEAAGTARSSTAAAPAAEPVAGVAAGALHAAAAEEALRAERLGAEAAHPAEAAPQDPELASRLAEALKRVEVLEARLAAEKQQAAKPRDEREGRPMKASMLPLEAEVSPFDMMAQLPTFVTAQSAMLGVALATSSSPVPYRRFSFDEFRREESRKLQKTHLRVVCPPDYFPLPLGKK